MGKGSQEEAFKTQTQLTILETQRVQVERDRRARTAEINSILNRPAGTEILRPPDSHVHEIAHDAWKNCSRTRTIRRRSYDAIRS